MKRFLLAITFFSISICICVFEQVAIKQSYNTINNDINNIELELVQNESIDNSLKQLKIDYCKLETKLNIIYDEESLGTFKLTIEELNYCDQSEKIKTLAKARVLIKDIYDNQKLKFSNII